MIPFLRSTKVPGLILWLNGALVRVRVDEDGKIVRPVVVLASFGRFQPDDPNLARRIFSWIEEREVDRRFEQSLAALMALEKILVNRHKQRLVGGAT